MKLKGFLFICLLWISGWQQVKSQAPEWSRLLEVSTYGSAIIYKLDWDGTNLYQAFTFSGNMTYSGYQLTSVGQLDVVVTKTTTSGNTVWLTHFRNPDGISYVRALKGDPNGNLFVYVQYSGTITVGGIPVSGTNNFLAKLDGSGAVVWITPLQTTTVSLGKIDFDAAGNIYLACQGNRLIKFSPQGQIAWDQTYPAGTLNDIAISGPYLFLGVTIPSGTGTYQFGSYSISATTRTGVVMKANLDGQILSHLEARGNLSGTSAVVHLKSKPDGQLLILGAYSRDLIFNDYTWSSKTNGYYFYIAQCDTSLQVSWLTSSENTGLGYNSQLSQRLLLDNAGNIYLYGDPAKVQFGSIRAESVYYLMKFTPLGIPLDYISLQNSTTTPVMEGGGDIYSAGNWGSETPDLIGNIFLRKSDWSSRIIWQRISTGVMTGSARINYAKHDDLGNLYTSARISGYCDYFGKQINTPVAQTVLSKMGLAGNLLWSMPLTDVQSYSNNNPVGPQVAVDQEGSLVTLGKFENELEVGSRFLLVNQDAIADGYVTKLSADGEPLWVFQLHAGGTLNLYGTVTDEDGNILVSGSYQGTMTLGGETLNAQGKTGVFLLKLNPEGQKVWIRSYVADKVLSAFPASASDRSIYLAAGMTNAAGFTFGEQEQLRIADEGGNILIKFSPDGQPQWAKNYGRAAVDNTNRQPISIKTDDSGHCYLWGICGNNSVWNGTTYTNPFSRTSPTFPNRFLAKINASGDVLWTRMIFEKQSLSSMGDLLDIDEKGNAYVGCHFGDSISVAGNVFISEHSVFFLIMKFTSDGDLSWTKDIRSGTGFISSLSVLKENSLTICGNSVYSTFGPFTSTKKGGTTTAIASLGGLWPYFVPVWSRNGVDQMNINIYSALLDGADLAPGDEIGIFDGEICVGAGMVSETVTSGNLLKIIVSKDDGSGNGYTPGHPVTYRYYDKSTKKEITLVTATYNDSNPYWSTTGTFAVGATAFSALNGETMDMTTLSLKEGWNLVSTPVIPADPAIDQLFSPLIMSGELVKVMDESGNALENMGSFGGWNNAIGQVSLSEGYKVKVTTSCQLGIQGVNATLPWSIPLTAGWNIIGFPYGGEVNAMDVLQPLITRGHLIKAQDESGQSVEDFGEFGGWTNSIALFRPGKGYKVKVNSEEVLTIEAAYPKRAVPAPSKVPTLHFQTVHKGNGVDHMNINLVGLSGNLLQPGDEIAIFDGGNCVGAAVVLPYHIEAHLISLPASASDHGGLPGFTEVNPFIVRLWKAASGEEMVLEPEILKGTSGFRKNESTFASLEKYGTTWTPLNGKGVSGILVYPNPTTGKVFLASTPTGIGKTGISVMNSTGQEIIRRSLETFPGEIDLSGYAPGIYYLRITSDSISRTERITLQGK